MQVVRQTIILIVVLFFLTGCDYLPFGYTPIGEITIGPARYEGQELNVKGKVIKISKLPFFEIKSYTLQDRTGEIIVVTEHTLPSVDETVAIKAIVKTAAILDNQSFGLRLQEVKKLPSFSFGG